jgi:hypothetical protein
VGWGAPAQGREAKGLEVFNEAVAFHGRCQEAGEIESFEIVLLAAHGGGLAGFILIRGSAEQCAALRAREDFQRLNARANLIVEDFGVIDAVTGDGVGEQVAIYQEAIAAVA